ncbi:MAG TPA: hypothetical protein VFW75_16900 [Acetobacteraceae bacterium]|nr:hypothetical protein [Acetobacteraceae bacterium]
MPALALKAVAGFRHLLDGRTEMRLVIAILAIVCGAALTLGGCTNLGGAPATSTVEPNGGGGGGGAGY